MPSLEPQPSFQRMQISRIQAMKKIRKVMQQILVQTNELLILVVKRRQSQVKKHL